MTVTQDLDIWTLILHASMVVKVVMGLLVLVDPPRERPDRQVRARVLERQ